jgi:hypothetical protein
MDVNVMGLGGGCWLLGIVPRGAANDRPPGA